MKPALSAEQKAEEQRVEAIVFYNTAILQCKQTILEAITVLNSKIGMDVQKIELEQTEYHERIITSGVSLTFKK